MVGFQGSLIDLPGKAILVLYDVGHLVRETYFFSFSFLLFFLSFVLLSFVLSFVLSFLFLALQHVTKYQHNTKEKRQQPPPQKKPFVGRTIELALVSVFLLLLTPIQERSNEENRVPDAKKLPPHYDNAVEW